MFLYSRARSDPTIHMNAMNPNMYYNGQQWTPDFFTNGQGPQTSYCPPAMPPPPHMGYPPAQQYAQPPVVNYGDPNQMHQQEMQIGSLPNHVQMQNPIHPGYMMQQQPSTSNVGVMGPMSAGPHNNQQLSTPNVVGESQSAPTSPAQSYDAPMMQNWPPTRHYSASPDTMDIPNIVLTGADGSLDCFQDLHLDSDDMQQLLNNTVDHQLDPACETQLMNG